MARTSQNGWPVILDREKITDPVLFGEDFPNGWLKGDVDVVFRYLITRLHREVEPIDFAHRADDWGYYVKNIEGSAVESNHSSGTAFDYNAHTHPMGVRNTYSEADRRKIRAILADLNGVVRWGGDYTGRPDDMHFEIDAGAAAVKREADRIRKQEQEDDVTEKQLLAAIEKALDAYVSSKKGAGKLASAVLAYDPGRDADGKVPSGGIPNPDPAGVAAGNTTIAATSALRDASVARTAAEGARREIAALASRVDTLSAKLDAILAAVTPEPGADEIAR